MKYQRLNQPILAAVLHDYSRSLQENVDKVLTIRQIIYIYIFNTVDFYYTLQHVSTIQISHQQVDIRYTQKMSTCCINLDFRHICPLAYSLFASQSYTVVKCELPNETANEKRIKIQLIQRMVGRPTAL
jgi:hypothetical protein